MNATESKRLTGLLQFDQRVFDALNNDFDMLDCHHCPTDAAVDRVLVALGSDPSDEVMAARVYTTIKYLGTLLRAKYPLTPRY
jgi:hypothetical protein